MRIQNLELVPKKNWQLKKFMYDMDTKEAYKALLQCIDSILWFTGPDM